MRKLILKIKNSSGVSILMALLLLLTVTMVTSVVLASANTAATKSKYDRKQMQAYMAVSSAAQYMKEQLEDGECKVIINKSSGELADPDPDSDPGPFYPLLSSAISAVMSGDEGGGVFASDFYLRLSDGEYDIPPVKTEFRMRQAENTEAGGEGSTEGAPAGADIDVYFSVYDPEDKKDPNNPEIDYWMQLALRGTAEVEKAEDPEDDTVVFSWRSGSVTKGHDLEEYYEH